MRQVAVGKVGVRWQGVGGRAQEVGRDVEGGGKGAGKGGRKVVGRWQQRGEKVMGRWG